MKAHVVQHVSKLTAIYRLRRQNQCGQNELNTYSKLLLDFYISFGIIPKDGKITQQTPVCGLPSEYYPTMSDFLSYLNRRIQEYEPSADAEHGELGKKFLLQADEIRSTYENLVRKLWKFVGWSYKHPKHQPDNKYCVSMSILC